MESSYIIFYIVLWIIALLYHYWKFRKVDAGFVLLLSYLIYAFSSYALYSDIFYSRLYYGITLLPFIILFILLYTTSWPILKFSSYKIELIQSPSIKKINFFCWLYFFMSLLNLPGIISKINFLSLIIMSQDAGADLYAESVSDSVYTASSMGNGISNFASLYTNFFSRLSILFLFYHLTLPNINKKIVLTLLLSIIIYVFSFLLTGQRGGTFKTIMTCIITFYALKPFIQPKVKKIIYKIGFWSLGILCIPYYFLTLSRFSDIGGGILSSLYSYIGQGVLNFNLYALDNNGIRYGDRVIPLFKKMIGFENVPDNFWERRWKYPNLRINDESFITYVGDFILDFGPFIGTIILWSISLIVWRKTLVKNKTLLFHQLILLHLLMCMCMEGGMSLYSFADSSNMVLLVYLFMYLFFKYDYISRKRKLASLNQ